MNDSNSIIIEAWNTILFDKFVRFRHLLVDGLSQHSDAALQRHPYPQGAHVLDVGCGFGDSTLRIAQRVGPAGSATGVDCAENFIRAAQQDAQDNGVQNANFQIRDVEWDDLGGPYDHAFARFGTMFFAMPGAAMRNICRALKPGGTFTQIVWRKREDNPWLHEAELHVKAIVPVVSHEDTDQVHCGPGPFSMAGADMVSDMLGGAGFSNITLERHDCDICIGRDLDDAIAFAMALGPAGEIIRLAGEQGTACTDEVVAALRETFASYARDDGVWAPSSTWFIRATAH
ncbi:methyltransferase domain-containing protein [Oleiagrimonas citrea]|uniref:Class I SAM-dependent methyltransferase n=1 Tax=Oleiagrimonas citrea TaxID=1665687 RepID=A0A846ZN60_9GAMM|nr:class I SAM-dependent methyltransferase [Oleiagrimonas citrea]NKZ39137.1 class I SAM-dependent methyltransferase [Oleiagrimonas citrea]